MRSSVSLFTLTILTFALLTSGCETTDRALTAAGRVARGQTGQAIIDLAAGKDTQNYKSRAIVDFDSGEILVETLRV